MSIFHRHFAGKTLQLIFAISLGTGLLNTIPTWADTANVNTGAANGSIIGDHGQQANGAGIGVNGNVNGSNLNNNQNSNTNVVQPIVLTQPNYTSSGQGGSSALILPRNPLALPNAALGRSNFGLQFGVQNNPGISTITGGKENGLGWFMQGGLTIPFGKIPAIVNNQQANKIDTIREGQMDAQRNVFGQANPSNNAAIQAERKVSGRVIGLNAYNYSTVSSGKLPLEQPGMNLGEITTPQPRVLALKPSEAFSQPLHTGEKVGLVEVGKEYPYLGHTRSGWVKILLPNGREAWTTTQFEYVKFDYTEIDTLAVDTSSPVQGKAAAASTTTSHAGVKVADTNLKKRRS